MTKHRIFSDHYVLLMLLDLAACLLYGIFFLAHPPVLNFLLPDQQNLILWTDLLIYRYRWPWAGVGFVLSFLALVGHYVCKPKHQRELISSSCARLLYYLMPLSFLPWTAVLLLMGDILPQDIVSNSVLFIPALVFSLIVARLFEGFMAREDGAENRREWTLVIFLLSTVLYAWLGYHIAEVTGEHVGDEGHYLTLAESLYYDHDLDIKNNILQKVAEKKRSGLLQRRGYLHISPNSRGDHWYSWHSFGLPLILAPVFGLGRLMRYIMLGMIAALGNMAMYKTSRGVGAGRSTSLATVLSFGSSVYWGLYSARALPEVLGATLVAWLFWAIVSQGKRPWLTVCLGSFCCTYLPMTHHRFLLMSLMGMGFYGLFGLLSGEAWRRKILCMAIFSILCVLGLGIFFLSQYLMYEGGMVYEVGSVVEFYPLGIWGIIADSRGLVAIMPSFMWLLASLIAWIIISPKNRLFSLSVLVTFMACLLLLCSNRWYVGGSCVPGRYIVAVIPLLIPGAAYMLQRTSSVARWWLFFLSAVSTSLLIMVLYLLPVIGRGFILPVYTLSNSHPILARLYHPHASFLFSSIGISRFLTTVYVAAGMILTTMILFIPEKMKRYSISLVSIIGVLGTVGHGVQFQRSTPYYYDAQHLAAYLSRLKLERTYIATKMNKPTSLFDISKVVFPDFTSATSVVGVTTFDLGVRMEGELVSQPNLEVNDWDGRGYRWATLTAPCPPTEGWRVLHIEGVMEGSAQPVFALREGSKTIHEGALNVINQKIDENIAFYCKGRRGHLYVLLHLKEGKGTFYLKELYWSPYSDKFIKDMNLYIPGKLSVAEVDRE